MEYSAQKQSGSTIVYVIVGIVLAAASVGAIIVAQHRGSQQVASQPSTEVVQRPADSSDSEEDEKQATDSANREKAEKEKAEKARQAEEKAKRAEEQKQADEKAAAEREKEVAAKEEAARKQAEQGQVAESAQGPMARTGVDTQVGSLPETGPIEDTLGMVVGVIAILGAGYFYYHFGGRQ